MEDNFIPIGEVAKQFNIEPTRLRDWCKRGFVYADMRSNVRYIPESEFEKIKMIIEFFEQGSKRTFKDLHEYLLKDDLLVEHKHLQEVKQLENTMAAVLEKQQIGQAFQLVAEKFNEQTKQMKQIMYTNEKLVDEIQDLRRIIEGLISLPIQVEDTETKQMVSQLIKRMEEADKERQLEQKSREIEMKERELQTQEIKHLLKSIENSRTSQNEEEIMDNKTLQKIMVELTAVRAEASAATEEVEKIKKRGFWARIFNK